MVSEARKLSVIEQVLKVDSEAVLDEVEALLNKFTKPTESMKLSTKYRGSLKLSDARFQELQQQMKNIRNEWERDI